MTKQHIKNRMKTSKDCFGESFDLFGSLSGFGWDPTTRRFTAEDEFWQELTRLSFFFHLLIVLSFILFPTNTI